MKHLMRLCAAAAATVLACSVWAESPQQIMERSVEARSERLEGVDTVTITKRILGQTLTEYYVRVMVEMKDGTVRAALRRLTAGEMRDRRGGGNAISQADPDTLRAAADTLRQQSAAVDREVDRQVSEAGIPKGFRSLAQAPPGQPWLSPNPGDMMNMYAFMLDKTAEAKEADAEARKESGEAPGQTMADFAEVAEQSRLVGTEDVDGRPAFHLRADDIDQVQQADGQEFRLNTLDLWIDTEAYVPLRMRMEGVAVQGRDRRPMVIERLAQDYREVPNSQLYEPYREVMRMQGVMSPGEEAQMAEARTQLEQMKQQLASLPENQKQMIMNQMGPQLEQLESLASGNGMEMVTEVIDITVNGGF